MDRNYQETNPKAFLRWPGSKKWLIKEFNNLLPISYHNYHEPFLGSASVFFSLQNKKAFLSDTNPHLINCFISIRDDVESVIISLKKFRNSKTYFEKIKSSQSSKKNISAAEFIYLNRTCFNGIFRVNSSGFFNVPFANRKNVDLVTEENLRRVSLKLKNTSILCIDFEKTLSNIKKNDLVFVDPPYVVSHINNGFLEYNEKIFSWNDQLRLFSYLKELNKIGAYFIMTNSSHASIKKLFLEFNKPLIVKRYSHIGGKAAARGEVKELIYRNF